MKKLHHYFNTNYLFTMEELYTEHEGVETCPVCGMTVTDFPNAIKFIDPNNNEEFFFDTSECYKQFMENPEQFARIKDEEEAES